MGRVQPAGVEPSVIANYLSRFASLNGLPAFNVPHGQAGIFKTTKTLAASCRTNRPGSWGAVLEGASHTRSDSESPKEVFQSEIENRKSAIIVALTGSSGTLKMSAS